MKLCDIQMLPGRIIDMENMADTLNAEDFLLEQLRGQIEDLERQVNITESTTLLSRHEKILGLPSDSEATLLDRRSRVVAKLLGQGTVTPKLVQYVSASFTNGAVDVTEYPEQYKLEIKFVGTVGIPPNMDDLTQTLRDILPAHLEWTYVYIFNTWSAAGALTWGQASTRTWQEMREREIDGYLCDYGGRNSRCWRVRDNVACRNTTWSNSNRERAYKSRICR